MRAWDVSAGDLDVQIWTEIHYVMYMSYSTSCMHHTCAAYHPPTHARTHKNIRTRPHARMHTLTGTHAHKHIKTHNTHTHLVCILM